ncbi:nitrogenase cofactor biosynthesis protein NifB [Anaerosinus massiliensis]|uniref:nitrogenase cofactor biosynthesis protein NifB n=1 Tax=Massilibacillus massiliensis TaxID=1806837 RepID=UPI000A579C52|nr:nitrogenase cofactor biosynthesis protein NifB [Massilibacillus massiliensis]
MGVNFTNLNVNPCKMCTPMGAVTALYGIKKCMSILHGSQGCSTYIRRHMATHYNEPVDIASSSLTEEGTVFGGASNLMKGLENLIRLYNPEVIGVSTTCLAETTGEDIKAIIKNFYTAHPDCKVKIIPVSTAGYAGTQYEGFFKALQAIVANVEMDTKKNNKINIITGLISPADTRYLKQLLDGLGVSYILLPDLSENLDGVHVDVYHRLPSEGTSLEEISQMAGAKFTIELSTFVSDDISPAKYLADHYGVPYKRMDLPVGLQATDTFIKQIVELGGVISTELAKERGRYLDAMVDSHKYNALGRATVFGEPDFVKAIINLCCENGIVPVVSATGAACTKFQEKIEAQIKKVADGLFVENYAMVDDADFETIEQLTLNLKANVMIGNSDARRISEKHSIDLVRCAFPIHDRVGGQRIQMIGYAGSLSLLDRVANTLLGAKERSFREELYEKYYMGSDKKQKASTGAVVSLPSSQTIAEKTATHPCYNCGAGQYARIHLPIAPKCNVQCNYCVRKYDCPNESRPGVTTEILTPEEAFQKYVMVKEKMPNLKVVGIAGPGDSLANFTETKETLKLIKAYDPEVTFCLSTNGLMLPLYAQDLIDLGVTHVTVTLNAIDPKVGAQIYRYVEYMGIRYTGESAAGILIGNQLSGLQYLTKRGIICKVNTVMLKGVNEAHIEDVIKKVKEIGCEISNIMQLIPVQGSAFETMPLVSNKEIMAMRKRCEVHLKQMYHCKQCRADAIGILGNDVSIEYRSCTDSSKNGVKDLALKRFAVATKSGMLVDQHFGQVNEFYIYESDGSTAQFVERRNVEKYCTGVENCEEKSSKMESILTAVKDCHSVLTLRIGDSPSKRLKEMGIGIVVTYDRIEDAVKKAANQ